MIPLKKFSAVMAQYSGGSSEPEFIAAYENKKDAEDLLRMINMCDPVKKVYIMPGVLFETMQGKSK